MNEFKGNMARIFESVWIEQVKTSKKVWQKSFTSKKKVFWATWKLLNWKKSSKQWSTLRETRSFENDYTVFCFVKIEVSKKESRKCLQDKEENYKEEVLWATNGGNKNSGTYKINDSTNAFVWKSQWQLRPPKPKKQTHKQTKKQKNDNIKERLTPL